MANFINEKGRITVSVDEQGSRLDRMLLRHLGSQKRTLIMRLIRKGNVRVNGKRCKPNLHLQLDDEVFLPASLRQSNAAEVSSGDISSFLLQQVENIPVLFEDACLLVLNKPAGLVVHGGSGHAAGLIEALKVSRNLPDLRLAHRLDRDTSGILLLAKNLQALRSLTESFRERDMDKTYIAWVQGHPEPHAARMTSRLCKGVSIAGERMVVDDVEGKISVTDYQVMLECEKDGVDFALLALKPHSGRTHQLRVQLQNEGHAILGDPKYAEKSSLKQFKTLSGKGLMLHAWRLRLWHPMTQKELIFIAPFPQRMAKFSTVETETESISMSATMPRLVLKRPLPKVILLDRDGVINFDSPDYILNPEQWLPIPGSLEAIAKLTEANIPIAIVSNQSAVGRGMLPNGLFQSIHAKMLLCIEELGGRIDHVSYCPHSPQDSCTCRKPLAGMVLESLAAFNMQDEPESACMIGDSLRDMQAAWTAAVPAMLVQSGYGDAAKILQKVREHDPSIQSFPDLAAAVQYILGR